MNTIGIIVALPAEARPLVKALRLQRAFDVHTHQLFRGDGVCLIVSGIGVVKAACATTCLCLPPHKVKTILNVGICGAPPTAELGSAYFIHSVTNTASGRSFFPDILLPHGMPEAALETVSRPAISAPDTLVDMEGAAIYESAQLFLSPSNIALIKIVSDHGVASIEKGPPGHAPFKGDAVDKLIEGVLDKILNVISIYSSLPDLDTDDPVLEKFVKKVSAHLKLSRTQQSLILRKAQAFYCRVGKLPSLTEMAIRASDSKFERNQSLQKICECLDATF